MFDDVFACFRGQTPFHLGGSTVNYCRPQTNPAGWKGREGELEELGQAAGSRACRGHGSDVLGTIFDGDSMGKATWLVNGLACFF